MYGRVAAPVTNLILEIDPFIPVSEMTQLLDGLYVGILVADMTELYNRDPFIAIYKVVFAGLKLIA
jgi:hypothetical protein